MDTNQEIITNTAEETAKIGGDVARELRTQNSMTKDQDRRARVLCLYGDLGSGKTTFTQGFARALGITQRLLSPTFIIVRRYDIPKSEKMLYHVDLYRMNSVEDMGELGLSEIFSDPNAIVVIEWAERLAELPDSRMDIRFATTGEKHVLQIKKI